MNVPVVGLSNNIAIAAASTVYGTLFCPNKDEYTTDPMRVYANIQNPGTFSNLATYLTTNGITVGTATLVTYVGGAAGNATLSFTSASGAGWFEDTVNTDSLDDNELWCTRLVGATTGSINTTAVQGLFAPTTGQFQILTHRLIDFTASHLVPQYLQFAGTDNQYSTTASIYGINIPFSGVLRNLLTRCDAYTRTGGTIDQLRTYQIEAAAAGNCTVTITAGAPTIFEDVTNTDTVTAGQRWCLQFNTDRTGGQCRLRGPASRIELHADAANFLFLAAREGAGNSDVDCAFPVSGACSRWGTAFDTRANMQHRADVAFTWSNLWANSLGAVAIIRSDINGSGAIGSGNGNQTITMAAGEVTDAVNTDVVAVGDLLSWGNDYQSGGAYIYAMSSMGAAIVAGGGALVPRQDPMRHMLIR